MNDKISMTRCCFRFFLCGIFVLIFIVQSGHVLSAGGLPGNNERVVILDDQLTSQNFGEKIEYLEGYEGQTIDDVISGRNAADFRYADSPFPSMGYSRSAYWIRFKVRNLAPHPVSWYLEYAYSAIDYIELYYPESAGYQFTVMGDTFPFSNRAIRYRNFIFPLITPSGDSTYYMRIISNGSMVIPLTAWNPDYFQQVREKENILYGIFYGFMLAFMCYHLIIFVFTRQRAHLFLSLMIAGVVMFSFVNSGLDFQYLWPFRPGWGNMSNPFSLIAACIPTLLFTRFFLKTSERFILLDRIIIGISIACLISLPAVFIFDYYYITQVSVIFSGLSGAIVIISGVASAVGKIKETRYFLSACLVFIGGVFLLVLRSYGFVPEVFQVTYGYQFGMCLMMFILSLGVADQINALRIEKEKAIGRLKDSEKRYRTLVENAHDGIILMKIENQNPKEGNVKYWVPYANPSFLRMLSCTPGEFYGAQVADFLPDTDKGKKAIWGHYRNRAKGDNQPSTFEAELMDKNGNIVDVIVSSSIIVFLEVKTLLAIVTDVTSLKKAEKTIMHQYQEIHSQYEELEALNEELVQTQNELIDMNDRLAHEKEQLASTLTSIGDAVITTDTEGRITLVNAAAEKLGGWTQAEASGRPVGEMFGFVDDQASLRASDTLSLILKKGGVVMSDTPVVVKGFDGVEHVVEMSGAAITIGDRIIGAVLAIREITERFKLEKELNKIGKLESLGMLAGGIAHDFNNLLTAIIGNLSLAREYAGDNAECRESIEMVEAASQRAVALTRQLLTFSKGGEPVKQTASIVDLLRENVNFLLSGSSVRPEFVFDNNVWPVEIDMDQISQVMHNIIINAVHAMLNGGILTLEAHNVTDPAGVPLPAGSYVEISISDTGCGISRRILSKIFDPYFTTRPNGTGLGLAICYSIIKKHKGYIDVESIEGKGSRFRIYLRASEQKLNRQVSPGQDITRMSGRILIMDDEKYILDASARMLSYLGYTAVSVSDGEEVLKIYEEARRNGTPFDLVIMDLTVPGGLGGLETIGRLRQIDPDVVSIVSSGYSNDPVMSDYSRYGFKGIIMKPYTMKDLMKVVRDILSGSQDRPALS